MCIDARWNMIVSVRVCIRLKRRRGGRQGTGDGRRRGGGEGKGRRGTFECAKSGRESLGDTQACRNWVGFELVLKYEA